MLADPTLFRSVWRTLFLIVILVSVRGYSYGAIVEDWQQFIGQGPESLSSAVLGDVNGDGTNEVVIGGRDGMVYAYDSTGAYLPGFPYPTGGTIYASAALGNLDSDSAFEIAVGSEDGYLYVLNGNGSSFGNWPQKCSSSIHCTPCIGDIDGDTVNDVLVGTTDGYLYAWDANGNLLPGFPAKVGGSGASIESSPCLGDMDQDRYMEIAVGCDDGYLYLFKYRMGQLEMMWAKRTGYFVRSSPAMGDIDGDGAYEVICGSDDFSMYAFEYNGNAVRGWPVTSTYKLNFSSPALGDMDNDNVLEVVFGSGDGYIYAYDGNGLPVTGWTHQDEGYSGETVNAPGVLLGGRIMNSSVVLADINNDGIVDAVVGSSNNKVYAVEGNGQPMTSEGFPYLLGGIDIYHITSAPAVGNIDRDSNLELLIPSSDNILYCFKLTNSSELRSAMPWPQFKQGPWRCSIYGYSGGIAELPSVTLTNITEEVSGQVAIQYILSDRQGDNLSIRSMYSLDYGKTWFDAKVIGETTGITQSNYKGSISWDSMADMIGPEERRGKTDVDPNIITEERRDYRELKSVKFRIIPSDANGVGNGGETDIFHVDNNKPPTITVTPVEAEIVGDVVFKYNISDEENDVVDLKVRYSPDGGATWKDASVTGQLSAIRPSRYDTGSLSWSSDTDEPYLDSDKVLVEVTPCDLDPGTPTQSNTFHLDNNRPPSVLLTDVYEEVSGDVPIEYELSDRENDNLSIACYYSSDAGQNFLPATVSGNATAITSANYKGSIIWKSDQDAGGVDSRTYQFRIVPKDNDEGKADNTGNFHMDNNKPPLMVINPVAGEQYGEFPITFSISDVEGDPVSIACEYSDDNGVTWRNATTTGLLTDIKPGDYNSSVLWDSLVDLLGVDSEVVLFRITPSDLDDGQPTVSPPIYVDNNAPPSVLLSDFVSEQTGDIEVFYTISDMEMDSISLKCKFSLDAGASWKEATVSGTTSGIDEGHYIGSLIWHSAMDAPNIFSNTAQFMITPWDKDEGNPGTTTSFALDNNEPPTIAILPVSQEKTTGDVTIPYQVNDPENDTCSIYCEYSLDDGQNFNPATVIGNTMSISPSEYNGSVIWSSLVDAKGIDFSNVIFRMTPSDLDPGQPTVSGAIHIDNNLPPDVIVSNPEGEQYADILIDYTIHDDETDVVRLACEWSEDGGETWHSAHVSGITDDIDSSGYIGSIYWLSKEDLPMADQTDIAFRIIPWDKDEGTFGRTDNLHLDNNERPSVDLADITEEQSGIVNIAYTIIDEEKDANEIHCEYSADGGFTWNQATMATLTSIDPTTYSGVARWVSNKDLPDVDRTDIMFKIIPYDLDPGFEGVAGPFHLDNNTLPITEVVPITAEESGDVPIQFTLSDPNNDTLTIEVEYSADGGQTWNTATVAGSTVNLEPKDYSGNVVWNSSLDLPGMDSEDTMVRVTPADNDPGTPGMSNKFHLDNNNPPTIAVADIPEEITGDVNVEFTIGDDEGDPVSLSAYFSLDGGNSWKPATISGATQNISRDNYFGSITWDTAKDLAGVDQKGILFKIVPADRDPGMEGITTGMYVDNNTPPQAAVTTPKQITGGMMVINYTLSDREQDILRISGEYSPDGGSTWEPASLVGNITGIGPSDYSGTINWDSASDMPGLDSSAVRFRIIPTDEDPGQGGETGGFRVDNNTPPMVTLEPIKDKVSGNITVDYTIEDVENDPVSIKLEYSPNNGTIWKQASFEGESQNISSMMYAGSLTWLSAQDLPATFSETVALRIIPSDENVGTAGEIGNITLDNNTPPQVTVEVSPQTFSGDVPVGYIISDPEGNTVDLIGEFSLDGGITWSPATLGGITSGITPANYRGNLTWHSAEDLPGIGMNTAVFSLTPSDRSKGEPSLSGNFNLDNNKKPSVSLGSPTVVSTGDVEIPYEFTDSEGDRLSFLSEYSADGGNTWEPATILGLSTDLGPEDYTGKVTWATTSDVAGKTLQGVQFRITPSDEKTGQSASITIGGLDLNRPPEITLTNPWSEEGKQVQLDYTIYDPEEDVVNLAVEYSTDGGETWKRASVTSGDKNITSENYMGSLIWDAHSDLGNTANNDVRLRVTPSDKKEGTPEISGTFAVNNNAPPTVAITGSKYNADDGTAHIDFTVSDAENDLVEVTCDFSEDGGLSWSKATVEGDTLDLRNGSHTLIWRKGEDIPTMVEGAKILFRITPFDAGTGQSAEVEIGS